MSVPMDSPQDITPERIDFSSYRDYVATSVTRHIGIASMSLPNEYAGKGRDTLLRLFKDSKDEQEKLLIALVLSEARYAARQIVPFLSAFVRYTVQSEVKEDAEIYLWNIVTGMARYGVKAGNYLWDILALYLTEGVPPSVRRACVYFFVLVGGHLPLTSFLMAGDKSPDEGIRTFARELGTEFYGNSDWITIPKAIRGATKK